MTTFLPFGPKVTFTALANASTPLLKRLLIRYRILFLLPFFDFGRILILNEFLILTDDS
jgi:hypothetical protein